MKELSIFIDESGTFGPYEYHSQFYLVTLVLHDQSIDISENINHLNCGISNSGIPNHTIHAGPLIRREYDYDRFSLLERKRIFNFLYNFVRTIDIKYHTVIVAKKHLAEDIDLVISISRKLSAFLRKHMEMLLKYDRIVVYYDYGQRELTHILGSVFNAVLSNVEFKKVAPADYKLFQAADMLCTLELLSEKAKHKILSNSELAFFSSAKNLYKSYIRAIQKRKID
jgi:hypothetical protein